MAKTAIGTTYYPLPNLALKLVGLGPWTLSGPPAPIPLCPPERDTAAHPRSASGWPYPAYSLCQTMPTKIPPFVWFPPCWSPSWSLCRWPSTHWPPQTCGHRQLWGRTGMLRQKHKDTQDLKLTASCNLLKWDQNDLNSYISLNYKVQHKMQSAEQFLALSRMWQDEFFSLLNFHPLIDHFVQLSSITAMLFYFIAFFHTTLWWKNLWRIELLLLEGN